MTRRSIDAARAFAIFALPAVMMGCGDGAAASKDDKIEQADPAEKRAAELESKADALVKTKVEQFAAESAREQQQAVQEQETARSNEGGAASADPSR